MINLACLFIILTCSAYLFPYMIALSTWIINKIESEEVVEQEEVIVIEEGLDSTEVEMPVIQHNNNKLLFPLDDMPQGIFLFDNEDGDMAPDTGIYSNEDREVSI